MSVTSTTTASKVLDVLVRITGTDEVRRNLDLPLFDTGLLDSLGVAELIIGLSDTLGIEIAPSEVERDLWSTPRQIIAYTEERIKA